MAPLLLWLNWCCCWHDAVLVTVVTKPAVITNTVFFPASLQGREGSGDTEWPSKWHMVLQKVCQSKEVKLDCKAAASSPASASGAVFPSPENKNKWSLKAWSGKQNQRKSTTSSPFVWVKSPNCSVQQGQLRTSKLLGRFRASFPRHVWRSSQKEACGAASWRAATVAASSGTGLALC